MSFGYDKCGVLNIRNGKACETTIIKEIPRLDMETGSKYLRILESLDFLTKTVKDNTIQENLCCIRKILKDNLTGHNTTTAIHAYTVPVM
eukprot:15331870-Ditylum_brightwellii.AAC.1